MNIRKTSLKIMIRQDKGELFNENENQNQVNNLTLKKQIESKKSRNITKLQLN